MTKLGKRSKAKDWKFFRAKKGVNVNKYGRL